jgi:hypothetical protein
MDSEMGWKVSLGMGLEVWSVECSIRCSEVGFAVGSIEYSVRRLGRWGSEVCLEVCSEVGSGLRRGLGRELSRNLSRGLAHRLGSGIRYGLGSGIGSELGRGSVMRSVERSVIGSEGGLCRDLSVLEVSSVRRAHWWRASAASE